MAYKPAFCLAVWLCLAVTALHAQSIDSVTGKVANFPSRLFSKIGSQSASLNGQITTQTERYLTRMMGREQRLQQKLAAVDSNSAKALFGSSQQQYAALAAQVRADTGARKATFSGQYLPNADTLQGAMSFLQKYPQLLSAGSGPSGSVTAATSAVQAKLQAASGQFQALQGKIQAADMVKAFVVQRQQQISQYLSQHTSLQGALGKQYSAMNQEAYYYSQQVQQYKAMLNDPGALVQRALAILGQLPPFQNFMKNNSQLGSLFHLPASYSNPQALGGVQTKQQVAQIVQGQVSAGGAAGAAALQSSLQSAQSDLDSYKDKLSKLGAGSGDAQMPDFKPGDSKTKTFFGRLQYGFNFQTTHNSYYYPTIVSLGLSLGYKLGHSNVAGIGVSYEMGAGNGINDIHITSNGLGLRSFAIFKIKGSLSLYTGFEYNYTTPFTSYQQLKQIQYWQRSGLLGITKTVSLKSKVLKQTTVSLLWDAWSCSNAPPTQPLLFRVGYSF